MPKCADCGYLSLISTLDRSLVEAELLVRTTGKIPSANGDPGSYAMAYDNRPVCFANVANFRSETVRGLTEETRYEVFSKERDCSEFIPWRQGHSPKEHMDVYLLQQAAILQRAENEARERREIAKEQRNAARDDAREGREVDREKREIKRDETVQKNANRSLFLALIMPPLIAMMTAWLNSMRQTPPPQIHVAPATPVVPTVIIHPIAMPSTSSAPTATSPPAPVAKPNSTTP